MASTGRRPNRTAAVLALDEICVKLQSECGLPDVRWATLWQSIRNKINDPRSAVLREGVEKHGDMWEDQFDEFCAEITVKYWGTGSREIWSAGDNENSPDRPKIREFVRNCFLHGLSIAARTHLPIPTLLRSQNTPKDPRSPSGLVNMARESDDEIASSPLPRGKTPKWTNSRQSKRGRATDTAQEAGSSASRISYVIKKTRVGSDITPASQTGVSVPSTAEFFNARDITPDENDTPTPVHTVGSHQVDLIQLLALEERNTQRQEKTSLPSQHSPKFYAAYRGATQTPATALGTQNSPTDINGAIALKFTPGKVYTPTATAPTQVPSANSTGQGAVIRTVRNRVSGANSTRPHVTLHSTVFDAEGYTSKLIHVIGGITLRALVIKLNEKHNFDQHQEIAAIGIIFQGDFITMELHDPDSEWDWSAWMQIEGKDGGVFKLYVYVGEA